eukprot:g10098.t1
MELWQWLLLWANCWILISSTELARCTSDVSSYMQKMEASFMSAAAEAKDYLPIGRCDCILDDDTKETPLHRAVNLASHGSVPLGPLKVVLEALLAKHGDLQAQDSTGATPSGTQERGGGLGRGFDACIKGGVKLFDTAEIYGPGRSEELLGQFLRESGAKDVQVATKFAAFPWKLDRSEVVKACKGSLERLGMDSIDIYQIHFPSVWKNEVFWDGLGDCYEQGLVKAVGVSNYGSSAVRAISKTLGERGIPLTSNQIQYSLLYRYPELNGMKATCDELGDVAGQHGPETTLSQVAIAWCIAKGTTPIPGVRNVRQAEERPDRCGAAPKDNLRALQLKLSSSEVEALDGAAAKVSGFLTPQDGPFGKFLSESKDTKQRMLHLAAFHGQASATSILAAAALRSSAGRRIFGIQDELGRRDQENLTPLGKALKVWQVPPARILALSGAPAANATLQLECQPELVEAVLKTDLAASSQLIAAAEVPNTAGHCLVPPNPGRNSSLLHLASALSAEEGALQVIQLLLDAGAQLHHADRNGETALIAALRPGSRDGVTARR